VERVKGLEVTLELNSLEEAFLAILNDPEIMTEVSGIELATTFDQRSEVIYPRPFLAMIVKNLLIIKSNPIRSSTLYFLNILFVVIGIVMSNFLEQIASENASEEIDMNKMMDQKSVTRKMMMMQGYYLSVGIYVTVAVYENEKKIIDVLRVRGLEWWYYWTANFTVDYAIFLVNLCLMKLLLGDVLEYWYMALFGVALILYCYCFSFLFKSSEKSVKYFPMLNLFVGLFIPLVSLISNEDIKNTILWLFKYLYPLYSLQSKFSPKLMTS
jgi:hypothetical protein